MTVANVKKIWTEEELQALPDDGFDYEVVNGDLVMSPKTTVQQENICAVEVLSPNTARADIDERLADFFASGTKIAWIIDPETESVEVYHSLTQRRLIDTGGHLDGEDLLPRFRHRVADLFKEWDWE